MKIIDTVIEWLNWSLVTGFDYLVSTGLMTEIMIGLVFLTFVVAILSSMRSHPII